MEKLEWRTCWRRLLDKVEEAEDTTRRYWAPPREIAVRVELMGMRSSLGPKPVYRGTVGSTTREEEEEQGDGRIRT